MKKKSCINCVYCDYNNKCRFHGFYIGYQTDPCDEYVFYYNE